SCWPGCSRCRSRWACRHCCSGWRPRCSSDAASSPQKATATVAFLLTPGHRACNPFIYSLISVLTEMEKSLQLTPVKQKFILHWGEMGTRWGVNRTVSQIHALLFLADAPLHAEEIAETLVVARSNVSNSLKELQS